MSASGRRRPSQNEQLLAILADGRWHTTRSLIVAVPCVLHSRIAELKARGVLVEHRGSGGGAENHEYRLAGPLAEPTSTPSVSPHGGEGPPSRSGVGSVSGVELTASSDSSDGDGAAQLSLEVAA